MMLQLMCYLAVDKSRQLDGVLLDILISEQLAVINLSLV